jgi:hypothetical protein
VPRTFERERERERETCSTDLALEQNKTIDSLVKSARKFADVLIFEFSSRNVSLP